MKDSYSTKEENTERLSMGSPSLHQHWGYGEVWIKPDPIPKKKSVTYCSDCGMRLNMYNFSHLCMPYKHDLAMIFYNWHKDDRAPAILGYKRSSLG